MKGKLFLIPTLVSVSFSEQAEITRVVIESHFSDANHPEAHVSCRKLGHADAGREKRATGRSLDRRNKVTLTAEC